MKLFRFGTHDSEKPGVHYLGKNYDCSAHFNDWNRDFFDNDGLMKLKKILTEGSAQLGEINNPFRFGSCVGIPGKIVCIGLNYRDHAKETKQDIPKEPITFLKATTALSGPFDDIIIPRNSKKTDWEVELGFVIGKTVRYLKSEKDADQYIAGFTIAHDISEREFQLEHGGQWSKGKSCDTFFPMGPYLVTPDEIKDVLNLSLQLRVNGQIMQNGNTQHMIFSPAYLVYYISQFMTLEAGDVISTGTPAGVGLGRSPQQFLKHGDVVEIEVDSLGKQIQKCRNYTD